MQNSKIVSNGAKIRNRYNQVPHLTQDTNGKVTNSQKTPEKKSAVSCTLNMFLLSCGDKCYFSISRGASGWSVIRAFPGHSHLPFGIVRNRNRVKPQLHIPDSGYDSSRFVPMRPIL